MAKRRKDEIVEVALALLADVPLAKLTTRMIAKRVGVTQPALFRHFHSRDALLLAAVERTRSKLGDLAASVLEGDEDGPSRLLKMAMGLLAHVDHNPGMPRLLFSDAHLGAESLRAALRHLVSMQVAFASELVRAGQREGKITGRYPANLLGSAFVAILQGIILQWQLQDRSYSLADRAEQSLAVLLEGMAPLPDEPRNLPKETAIERTMRLLRSLDVRPILAKGEDPLESVLDTLAPNALLLLSSPFHPKPLVLLLEGKGYKVAIEHAEDDSYELAISGPGFPEIEDLRDLEPPEPLERILAASSSLTDERTLAFHVPRFPALLVGRLEERHVSFEVLERQDGTALLVISRSQ